MPPSFPQTVLLTGATGTAGLGAAAALVAEGHNVIAFGRRDPGLSGVAFHAGDVEALADVSAVFAQHRPTAVVSCLASRTGAAKDAWAIDHAAHLALLTAAKEVGVSQFVLLSAICVQKPRLAFQHAKLAFENALISSGMTYSIVRPTALFKSLSGQLARIEAGKPYLMFGDGTLTACKPISDRDLGCYIASCLTDPDKKNRILPVGGPGPALTPRDMGAALFALTGQPPKYRTVPLRLISGIASVLGLAGAISSRARDKAEFARIGHYYASESMLVWDEARNRYDAAATPEYGQDTLFGYYQDLISGKTTLERGAHAVF